MVIDCFADPAFREDRVGFIEFKRVRTYYFTDESETTFQSGPPLLHAGISVRIIVGCIVGARYVSGRVTRRSS